MNLPILELNFKNMLKAEIRKQALKYRTLLSNTEFERLNHQLLVNFQKLDLGEVKTIHIFIPILEKREPDTFLLINWLKSNYPSIKILIPKSDFETYEMISYVFTEDTVLKKNKYNILEPEAGEIFTGTIDLVIVPLLAFDEVGNRVGYGKGFYDRFFAHYKVNKKMGLCLESAPYPKFMETSKFDVKLDACITPEKIFFF